MAGHISDFDSRDTTILRPAGLPQGIRQVRERAPGTWQEPIERSQHFQVPDNIASELARFLEDQIICGELRPGARLVEEDIVASYKVSRSPVREAFRVLEHEGLAVRSPRRGIRVSEINVDDYNDLCAPRLLLEGQAAENAARHRTTAQLDAIRGAADALQTRFADAHTRQFFAGSLDFSRAVHAACGNRTLRRLLDHVGKQAMRYRFLVYTHVPEMMDLTASSAASIAEAIARRDAAGARVVTQMLLEQGRDRLRDAMPLKD